VIIPRDNEKDLTEIPKNIKDKLDIVPVRWIDEVLEISLQHLPVPASEQLAEKDKSKQPAKSDEKGVRAH